MGKLEEKSAKRTRVTKIQRAILGTVASVGVMSVAVLAPNAMRMLRPLINKMDRSRQNSIYRARRLLIEKNLLTYIPNKPGFVRLTYAGATLLRKIERMSYQINRPKQWDGKWRVLIFDISEKRKDVRHKLRLTLQSVGFVHLQDSVWVYPYPCEEFVALLKADYKIGYSLLYLIVEEMEGDKQLRKAFNLPNLN